jgi:hypothetical protein
MIRLVLEMSDETYEQLRCGIKCGFFTFSLNDLERFNIKVASIQPYCSGDKQDD